MKVSMKMVQSYTGCTRSGRSVLNRQALTMVRLGRKEAETVSPDAGQWVQRSGVRYRRARERRTIHGIDTLAQKPLADAQDRRLRSIIERHTGCVARAWYTMVG